jgi:hypothetical protein
MRARVLVSERAIVTAGFTNNGEAVNQYAAAICAPTANGIAADPTKKGRGRTP